VINNNSFSLTLSPLKITLAIISLIIWLCALASLIYSSPQYIPYTEALLHCGFESPLQKDNSSSQLVLEPWHHVSQGVSWEPGNGFSGSTGIKLTANAENQTYVKWELDNPQRFSFLKFRGKMRSEKIIPDEEEWETARFLVYFTKEGEGQWDIPHVAGKLTGTSDWKEFVKIFPVPDNAEEAYLVIENKGRSGTVWCDDILLMPVKINTRYLLYKNIFFVSGAVIGVFLCILMVFTLGLRKRDGLLTLAIVSVIIIGVLCSINYLEMLGNIFNIEPFLLKKFGHFILFFILGVVSIRQLGAKVPIRANDSLFPPYSFPVFAGLVLFACLTEALQFFTFDRTPSFIDLLIDMTGIGTGIVLACFVKKELRK
jgi:VanZ family protein